MLAVGQGMTMNRQCYVYDGNGNVTEVVDSNDVVAAHYEYDPYGNVTSRSGAVATNNPFRFSTKYADEETGLVYYGYRYYSPELGRWVSRDPVGERGGINLYQLTYNNALNLFDRLGLDVFVCPSIWDYTRKYGTGGPDDPEGTPFDPFPGGSGGGLYLGLGVEVTYSSGSCCNSAKKFVRYDVRTVCGGIGLAAGLGGSSFTVRDTRAEACPPEGRTYLLAAGNPLSIVPGFGPGFGMAPDIGVTWCPNSGVSPFIGGSFGFGFGRIAICHDSILNPHEAGCCISK